MDEVSDEKLLASIAAGSPNWTAVYERCRHAMFGTARRFFHTSDEAWGGLSATDVVQAVMVEVMEKGLPTDIDTIERLRAFLVTITWRRAHNASQRHAATHETLPRPGSPYELNDETFEDRVHNQILASQAIALVGQLPDREGQVIREHILKARNQGDVATEMGVSDARVRQLRTSGLRQLRALIDNTANATRQKGGTPCE
jgi:RNA polymerase sigma factor (sigma-70 family)